MNKFKEVIEILSKFSTIGIFVLALFGYFYTVLPKFELDNMKIDMEALKKEKNELNYQINEYNSNIEKLKIEKDNLTLSLENLNINYKNDVTLLKDKIKQYNDDIEKKENHIIKINSTIDKYNLNLFITYLFNGVDMFNTDESKFVTVTFGGRSDRSSNENFSLLKISDKDKVLLDNNAPYKLFIDKVNSFEYEKNMLFSKKQFTDIKKYFINKINAHKSYLIYNSNDFKNNLSELNNKRQVMIDSLNSLKKSLEDLDKEEEVLPRYEYFEKFNKLNLNIYYAKLDLIRNGSDYSLLTINEHKKIDSKIQKFINEFIYNK